MIDPKYDPERNKSWADEIEDDLAETLILDGLYIWNGPGALPPANRRGE